MKELDVTDGGGVGEDGESFSEFMVPGAAEGHGGDGGAEFGAHDG